MSIKKEDVCKKNKKNNINLFFIFLSAFSWVFILAIIFTLAGLGFGILGILFNFSLLNIIIFKTFLFMIYFFVTLAVLRDIISDYKGDKK